MDLSFLCHNSLLIVPKNNRDNIVKKISFLPHFYSYKIIDEVQLKKEVFFDYDIKTLDYLHRTYNIKLDVAKEYVESMYFLNKDSYTDQKLDKLAKIKKELIDKNLLIINHNFLKLISNKKIFVYGFDVISKEMKFILDSLKQDYQIINEKYDDLKINNVLHYETLEHEVDGLCYQISVLLNNNVDINKIKLANVNNDYIFTLKRYFKMYNIPLKDFNDTNLLNLICVKGFVDKLQESKNIQDSLEYFLDNYPNEIDIYHKLVNVLNQFILLDCWSIESVKYVLKNTNLPVKKYKNVIDTIDLDDYIFDDEYVFVLSINQGIYPKTYKDESFLNDSQRKILNIDTSDDLNKQAKERFKILLRKNSNIILSFKDKSAFSSFNMSFVIKECNLKINELVRNNYISYSKQTDKLKLAKIFDHIYEKTSDNYICMLNNSYTIPYKEYNHKFKMFGEEKIKEFIINKQKSISYSSISNYFQCGFKYYLNDLLGLGSDVSSQSIDIGLVFHKVLELSYKNDFDFEKIYQEELSKIDDVVTAFYLEKLKDTLVDIIKINRDNMDSSLLKGVLTEQKVVINYTNPIPIQFKGFVDKVLYQEIDGKTYISIIDYKTGNPKIDVSKVKYGLSLQLPIYLYFLKHFKKFNNTEICGFYLQKLLPKKAKSNEDYYKILKESIALQGYSNSSKEVLSIFDPGFANSSMIKSMRIKNDGDFAKYAKVLSSEEMDSISEEVEAKIFEALENICNCNFEINPKMLDRKNQSCNYCEFNECCFKTHNDFTYLNGKKYECDYDGDENEYDDEDYEMAGELNGA